MSYLSLVEYTASGSAATFSVTFPYLERTDVHVFIDAVEDTTFTFDSDTVVRPTSIPTAGQIVRVERQTSRDTPLVDFSPGTLTEEDLDLAYTHGFYLGQEAIDRANRATSLLLPDPEAGKILRWSDSGAIENADIVALADVTVPVPVAQGGTGASSASAARSNLGLSLPLDVTSGGTGAADAATARTNLGINQANLGYLEVAGGTMTGGLYGVGLQIGQCRLEYVSTTEIRLERYDGRYLFINGVWREIPSTHVSVSNSGLSASSTYNVYAYWTGSAIALEISGTGRATDSTYGHQIKNGDASRTLVGKVKTDSSSLFTYSATIKHVISWFNRKLDRCQSHFAATRTLSATSWSQINSETVHNWLSWGDDKVFLRYQGPAELSTTGAIYVGVAYDTTSSPLDASYTEFSTSGSASSFSCFNSFGPTEGAHYDTIVAQVSAGTASFFGGNIMNHESEIWV